MPKRYYKATCEFLFLNKFCYIVISREKSQSKGNKIYLNWMNYKSPTSIEKYLILLIIILIYYIIQNRLKMIFYFVLDLSTQMELSLLSYHNQQLQYINCIHYKTPKIQQLDNFIRFFDKNLIMYYLLTN